MRNNHGRKQQPAVSLLKVFLIKFSMLWFSCKHNKTETFLFQSQRTDSLSVLYFLKYVTYNSLLSLLGGSYVLCFCIPASFYGLHVCGETDLSAT